MTTEGFANDGTMLKNLAQFDLAREMMDSEQKRPWLMGHFARTLFKKSDFRMVLIRWIKAHSEGTSRGRHHFSPGLEGFDSILALSRAGSTFSLCVRVDVPR
jgi:hypothetical protein